MKSAAESAVPSALVSLLPNKHQRAPFGVRSVCGLSKNLPDLRDPNTNRNYTIFKEPIIPWNHAGKDSNFSQFATVKSKHAILASICFVRLCNRHRLARKAVTSYPTAHVLVSRQGGLTRMPGSRLFAWRCMQRILCETDNKTNGIGVAGETAKNYIILNKNEGAFCS